MADENKHPPTTEEKVAPETPRGPPTPEKNEQAVIPGMEKGPAAPSPEQPKPKRGRPPKEEKTAPAPKRPRKWTSSAVAARPRPRTILFLCAPLLTATKRNKMKRKITYFMQPKTKNGK